MPYKKSKQCPICGKPIYPYNVFCIKHKIFTPEHRKHISEALKGKSKPWLKGKKRPEHSKKLKEWWNNHPEMKEKARQRAIKLKYDQEWIKKVSNYGEKNPMWRGGISNHNYIGFYQLLKDEIRERDNYKCQLCGLTEEESLQLWKKRLAINHIDYDKTNNKKDNLITLCLRCNSKINFEREKWKQYFKEKIASINGNGK